MFNFQQVLLYIYFVCFILVFSSVYRYYRQVHSEFLIFRNSSSVLGLQQKETSSEREWSKYFLPEPIPKRICSINSIFIVDFTALLVFSFTIKLIVLETEQEAYFESYSVLY